MAREDVARAAAAALASSGGANERLDITGAELLTVPEIATIASGEPYGVAGLTVRRMNVKGAAGERTMRTRLFALIVVVGAATWGCSSESETFADAGVGSADGGNADAAGVAARTDSEAAPELIDRTLIDSCAGFDAEKAASMLGVSAAELEVEESFAERFGGQTCRYWSAASRIGPGIQFLLNVQESSEAATQVLDSQRSVVPRVDAVPPTGPALVEFDVGDEAFWDTNTGGVNVRVRNVVATVHVSTSGNSMSDRDPAQIDLERRVAEDIAAALLR